MTPRRRGNAPRDRGHEAEERARAYLERRGLRTLARNFRTRRGEIDLVMADGGVTVFVEVRRRSHPGYGGAAASVDRRKRQRLSRAANVWLARNPGWARFDVVATDGNEVHWVRDAFQEER
ncbi:MULTISPECIES: YraN family protein [unclassified Halorhodospira]|uniref:YraN family protein n=1 Tax=unclassified Halorhodospira TaxID=2626748 RepID=UPI001EE91A9E|nr:MULTISPECIES: YraN family protein [unclassified Halorhodospira]MCG5542029.1 YraN family protein [Halorhodospira sp. M39old]MCG5546249.1 YraN family protein [Halorhodospira sp. M38]